MADESERYPGELASPQQVHDLAEAYREAAHSLLKLGRPGKPLTRAPFRLSAIHAIELYLNALLLKVGRSPQEIRKLQHDLGKRTALAQASELSLRKRTAEHLQSLSDGREYLVTRYGPELAATASQVNRLTATLEEVAKKVTKLLSLPSETPSRSKSAAVDSVAGSRAGERPVADRPIATAHR